MQYSLSDQNEKKLIRFIDSQYNTLFYLEDGKNLILDSNNGQIILGPCSYIDSHHFSFQNRTWHICEFAEFHERNHIFYRPEGTSIILSEDIFKLAQDTMKLAREIDPYEYMDSYETEEELFNEIIHAIVNGQVTEMIEWYRPIVEEEFKEANEAQNIIDRLEKFQKKSNEITSINNLIDIADDKKTEPRARAKEYHLPER